MSEDEYQTRDGDPVEWRDFRELDGTVGDLFTRVEKLEVNGKRDHARRAYELEPLTDQQRTERLLGLVIEKLDRIAVALEKR